MTVEYVPPDPEKESFQCPHCQTHTRQYGTLLSHSGNIIPESKSRKCENCGNYTLWIDGTMIYPKASPAPFPHSDMPDNIERDFEEARNIVKDSPRAAAALLRLSLEKLVEELGATDGSLYSRIGDLVEEGEIDPRIQKACDSVRVVGNESVHPGTIIDVDNDQEIASTLFVMVNIIVDETISREKTVENFYDNLSEGQKQGIDDRDNG